MNIICTLKQATEHFHVRAEKMAQWTVYELSETAMLTILSYPFPYCAPLTIYTAKKPILLGCYLALAQGTEILTDQMQYYYGEEKCGISTTGEINVNFE